MSAGAKPVLIIQPGFAGDIFFCMKIAADYAARGHRVIYPVEDQFASIPAALELPPGVEMPLLSETFDMKDAYAAVSQAAELASASGDFGFHQGPVEIKDAIFLALASSWRAAVHDTMAVKYRLAGVDASDWADYVHLKRDPEREERLLQYLGIHPERDFVLLNESCRTKSFDLTVSGDAVRMGLVPGFTLFDWSAVAERAREIITIDTSLVLLVEVLKLRKPLQMLSRYSPPEFHVAPLLRLDWRLAGTVAELAAPVLQPVPTPAAGRLRGEAAEMALLGLAARLQAESRSSDALPIFEHLATLRPDRSDIRLGYVGALGAQGRTLEALEQLALLRDMNAGASNLLETIQAEAAPAIEKFNAHVASGDLAEAERYVAAVAKLTPNAPPILQVALAVNQSLGRSSEAVRYAQALSVLEPENTAARTVLAEISRASGDLDGEISHRIALALSEQNPTPGLLRLRDLHDLAGMILCRKLTAASKAQLDLLLSTAQSLNLEAPPGSEWEDWITHYKVLVEALDMERTLAPAPRAPEAEPHLMDTAHVQLVWAELRARADALGAQAVFFVAADSAYIELYARWYVLSILRYCDVPFLIVVHVIGGRDELRKACETVGVSDRRLVFSGDDFDTSAIATRCYDAPPKGLIAKPVAHLQSARFQKLAPILRAIGRPVFVSDIDLLLQRGVSDLLERSAGADLVLNENELTQNAGSRLTANLLLVNPTPNAETFLGFLSGYLGDQLGRERVTRWIDQVALVLARHNLEANAADLRLEYFDVASDINNVMYPSYQAHPFRFLSLYHGFDTSSLENDPRVLGEVVSAA